MSEKATLKEIEADDRVDCCILARLASHTVNGDGYVTTD